MTATLPKPFWLTVAESALTGAGYEIRDAWPHREDVPDAINTCIGTLHTGGFQATVVLCDGRAHQCLFLSLVDEAGAVVTTPVIEFGEFVDGLYVELDVPTAVAHAVELAHDPAAYAATRAVTR